MRALSKSKVKFFTSLQRKKNRYANRLFLVEGVKMFQEAYQSDLKIEAIVIQDNKLDLLSTFYDLTVEDKCWQVSEALFGQMSQLQHPEGILTIIHFPQHIWGKETLGTKWPVSTTSSSLLLENLQDPGNVGTILRTADWFGMSDLYCSSDTVDFLNAKTLRASMGAIFRVNLHYISEWKEWINRHQDRILLADLKGESIQKTHIAHTDWILLGNEANGISEETKGIKGLRKVCIPGSGKAESLNVGIASAICMYHLSQL